MEIKYTVYRGRVHCLTSLVLQPSGGQASNNYTCNTIRQGLLGHTVYSSQDFGSILGLTDSTIKKTESVSSQQERRNSFPFMFQLPSFLLFYFLCFLHLFSMHKYYCVEVVTDIM